jgi:hypothetical protein
MPNHKYKITLYHNGIKYTVPYIWDYNPDYYINYNNQKNNIRFLDKPLFRSKL